MRRTASRNAINGVDIVHYYPRRFAFAAIPIEQGQHVVLALGQDLYNSSILTESHTSCVFPPRLAINAKKIIADSNTGYQRLTICSAF